MKLSKKILITLLNTKKLSVGGQAVMEGVMMRSKHSFAVACRIPTGQIALKEEKWQPVWSKWKFLRLPFLRGVVVLVEAMYNGLSALTFSSNLQIKYDEDSTEKEEELSPQATAIAISISVLFALGLFVALPHFLSTILGFNTASVNFHLVDGAIKVAILLLYLFGIGLIKEIRRVFQYHGAEHKAIFTYEYGEDLTVENARKHSRFHPRCGTSFLFFVIFVSIVLFSLILQFSISNNKIADNLIKIFIKIPLMLPVAGISYEIIAFSGKHQDNILLKPFILPGLWLQRLTTKEPDDDMLEVSLASLKKTLWREENIESENNDEVVLFANLSEIPLK